MGVGPLNKLIQTTQHGVVNINKKSAIFFLFLDIEKHVFSLFLPWRSQHKAIIQP
jgi:hypothetical protein